MIKVKRVLVVALGSAAAFATVPFVVAPSAVASNCPYGTVPTEFTGVCVSGQSGGFGSQQMVVPPDVTPVGPVFGGQPGQLPTVDGITCTPEHLGTCIGLAGQG